MPLSLVALTPALTAQAAHLAIVAFKDNLAAQVVFPNSSSPESIKHNTAEIDAELQQIEAAAPNTQKVWHLGILDSDKPEELLSYAVYHHVEPGSARLDSAGAFTAPPDANAEAFAIMSAQARRAREKVLGKDTPYLFLALVVTAAGARRKGGASMLLEWGKQKATELGVVCYLEASSAGAGLYRQRGWREMDRVLFDLRPWVGQGDDVVKEDVDLCMVWDPKQD